MNTYSLRYARITHMLRNDVSPSIAAKMMGHKNSDHANICTDKNGRGRAQNVR
jgi:site-specific recombinase XerD